MAVEWGLHNLFHRLGRYSNRDLVRHLGLILTKLTLGIQSTRYWQRPFISATSALRADNMWPSATPPADIIQVQLVLPGGSRQMFFTAIKSWQRQKIFS